MILLVEDSDDDVFIMKRAMGKLGSPHRLHVVINGQEAVDYLQGAGQYADRAAYPLPELIFLDLKLPIMTGFDVLRWINQQPSLAEIPVVILSSSVEERDRQTAKELGAKTFLVKPPTPQVLTDTFRMLALARQTG